MRAALAILLCATAARADTSVLPSANGCRDSRFERSWSKAVYHSDSDPDWHEATGWYSTLTVERDLDGDGQPDKLVARRVESYRWSSREVALVIGKRTFKAETHLDYHSMTAYTPVPKELIADPAARAVVEEALFARVCPSADPALQRLLAPSAPLAWQTGAPVLPRSYAIYSTHPDHRARAVAESQDEGQPPGEDTGAAWVLFDGDQLLPSPHGFPDGGQSRVRRAGKLVLARHAALIEDNGRHAWLYVADRGDHRRPDGAGGQLPRSVCMASGRITGHTAVLKRGCDEEVVRVDLTTGKSTTTEERGPDL